MTGRFLPGVPGPDIEAIFEAAPGNEIGTGKFDNPESSAALAANALPATWRIRGTRIDTRWPASPTVPGLLP